LNIAAAAIKIARADEKQRPIAEVGEVKDDRKRPEGDPGVRSGKRSLLGVIVGR
jgi:flagellar biosynthesis protein FlhB